MKVQNGSRVADEVIVVVLLANVLVAKALQNGVRAVERGR